LLDEERDNSNIREGRSGTVRGSVDRRGGGGRVNCRFGGPRRRPCRLNEFPIFKGEIPKGGRRGNIGGGEIPIFGGKGKRVLSGTKQGLSRSLLDLLHQGEG